MVPGFMSSSSVELGEFGFSGDDHVVPFDVDGLDLRGRAVHVGPMLDQILDRHNYPEPVSRLLAEIIALTIMLGSSLKFDGKFIVQTNTNGPVDLLVADFVTPGSVRAYARFDDERLAEAVAAGKTSPEELLGVGVLALTIDQGVHMQRYQGIVQLDGSTLEEVARNYFKQSEQIPTEVRLGVARIQVPGEKGVVESWRAGGMLIQSLPNSADLSRMADFTDGDDDHAASGQHVDDTWQEALALLRTVQDDELLDPSVSMERLLYRLFHEHGVRVYDGVDVIDQCSCSREKIKSILDGFTSDEIVESTVDGIINVDCEFCSEEYVFEPGEFTKE